MKVFKYKKCKRIEFRIDEFFKHSGLFILTLLSLAAFVSSILIFTNVIVIPPDVVEINNQTVQKQYDYSNRDWAGAILFIVSLAGTALLIWGCWACAYDNEYFFGLKPYWSKRIVSAKQEISFAKVQAILFWIRRYWKKIDNIRIFRIIHLEKDMYEVEYSYDYEGAEREIDYSNTINLKACEKLFIDYLNKQIQESEKELS